MNPARGGRAVSRLVVAVAVIIVIVVGGGYVLLGRGSTTSTQTSSSVPPPNVALSTAVNKLIQDLNARNVDSVVTYYTPDAVVRWSGKTGGLSGLYAGTDNIRLIYATTVGKATTLNANASGYAEKTFNPSRINATFLIQLRANSTVAGIVRATINVSEAWSWGGAAWEISKENWAYSYYDSSLIDAGIPVSATTFPQWRVMESGGNPDLVSEKSFEWRVGPYVAAFAYAFLFGVAALFLIRLRRIRGSAKLGGMNRYPPTGEARQHPDRTQQGRSSPN